MIPYGRQLITEDDIQAVVDVLRSPYLTQGPVVPNFERALGDFVTQKNVKVVASATGGLHLAYRALELGAGDEVWTSPISFAATANAALYCGASVDFVDIDPTTWNLDPRALASKLKLAQTQNRLPKIIAPVHLAGRSADLKTIRELASGYDIKVVEDAAHAIGAEYLGAKVGTCHYSDLCVFSFHPVKIITTGEGGAVLSQNEALDQKVELLRSHGITRRQEWLRQKDQPDFYYEMLELGYHYRMTDIQAALGMAQLSKIEPFVARRRHLAQRYERLLEDFPVVRPERDRADSLSSWHLYVIRVSKNRDQIFSDMKAKGIGVNLHYLPIYWHPYYQDLGFRKGLCPAAEKYSSEAITLPLHHALSDDEQDFVVGALKEALAKHS